jgi:hypothetical protein
MSESGQLHALPALPNRVGHRVVNCRSGLAVGHPPDFRRSIGPDRTHTMCQKLPFPASASHVLFQGPTIAPGNKPTLKTPGASEEFQGGHLVNFKEDRALATYAFKPARGRLSSAAPASFRPCRVWRHVSPTCDASCCDKGGCLRSAP